MDGWPEETRENIQTDKISDQEQAHLGIAITTRKPCVKKIKCLGVCLSSLKNLSIKELSPLAKRTSSPKSAPPPLSSLSSSSSSLPSSSTPPPPQP